MNEYQEQAADPTFWLDTTKAIKQVREAMSAAIAKHGMHQTPYSGVMDPREKFIILAEEIGEVARALTYDGYPDASADERRMNLACELEQVAAMALMWRASL